MKKRLIIFLTAILVYNSLLAQPTMGDVVGSLNANGIENVVKYFDDVVDITITNTQSTYSKSQAEMVIQNFFVKNAATSFHIKYKGNDADDSSFYLIGDLETRKNGSYRVYLFFKHKGKDYFLQEMKIEQ